MQLAGEGALEVILAQGVGVEIGQSGIERNRVKVDGGDAGRGA